MADAEASPGRTDGARFLIAGALTLSVAMGIGRFAYTPLIPIMERDAGLTVANAGALAFANLAGYLAGSVFAMLPATQRHRLAYVRGALAVVIVTTALMAGPSQLWLGLRFLTGAASGFALIFSSSIVLERAARFGKTAWPPIYFSGVGCGIAFSGAAVPAFASSGGSRTAWLGLAACALLAIGGTARWFVDDAPLRRANAGGSQSRGSFTWLLGVYTVEGFAYVIPATFLVAIVSATPALARYAAASWIVVGLAAATATFAWIALGARFGKARALGMALAIQGLGIALPAISASPAAALAAGLALGGTFVGITLFATALGRDYFPAAAPAAIGRLTVGYGVAQMLGPPVATWLALRTGSYASSLGVAAAIALGAAIVSFATVRDVSHATSEASR